MSLITCPVCESGRHDLVLDRPAVPVHQNRVLPDRATARAEPTARLALRTCARCGHAWNAAFEAERTTYGEGYDNRQEHSAAFDAYLDALVARLVADGVRDCDVVEVGCGQGQVLRRLCAAGACRGVGFDPAYRGPESVDGVRMLARPYGPAEAAIPADVVLCRHVIEHVPDPVGLLVSVRGALREQPGARIVFECPDARWIVEHDVLWDVFYEHAHYFTPTSLALAATRAGFTDVVVESAFGGQYQILTARPGARTHAAPAAARVPDWAGWARRVEGTRAAWTRRLATLAEDGPVVLWGAGAKGVTLAWLVDPTGERLAGLVDINPAKQGGFVTGSGHPVLAPAMLGEAGVRHAVVMNPAYLAEIRATVRSLGLDVAVHPPEIPLAAAGARRVGNGA